MRCARGSHRLQKRQEQARGNPGKEPIGPWNRPNAVGRPSGSVTDGRNQIEAWKARARGGPRLETGIAKPLSVVWMTTPPPGGCLWRRHFPRRNQRRGSHCGEGPRVTARSASARPVTRAEDEAPTSCSPGEAPAKAARPERGSSSDSMGFTGADQASVVCWLRGETSCLGSRLRPCAKASRAGTHGVDFAGGSPAYLWKGCWLRAPRERSAVFVGGRFGDWRRGRATMTK